MTDASTALWYRSPGHATVDETLLPPLGSGMVEIETKASLLSRGTERLIFEGRVPEAEWARMRAPLQEGDFPFPVKYGYAAAGRVVAGDEALLGRDVFALAPHQRRLRVPTTMAVPLPQGVPPERAVLAANIETALNAVWDASPQLGARILVVGLGLVGLLVTFVLTRMPDLSVAATDVLEERAEKAAHFSVNYVTQTEIKSEYDLVIHTSASEGGLETALNALRFEGVLIELSWYGDRPVAVPLGGAFHSQRLTIRSSQVGHVAPGRRASTTHRDRLAAALRLATDERLEALITETVDFDTLPVSLPRLLAPGAPGIATRVRY
ncbi:MAG: zinc-binding alcohol dehydrogenase [Pseudomonadota bacterium]